MKTLLQAEKDGTISKPKQYCNLFSFKPSGKNRPHVRRGKTAKDHKSGAHARRVQNQIKREPEVKLGGKKR